MMRLANLLAWLTVALVIVGCDSSGDSTTATPATQAGTESTASEDTALSASCLTAHGSFGPGLADAAAERALLRTLSACKTPAEWTQGGFAHSLGGTGATRAALTDAIAAFTGRPMEPVLREYSVQRDRSPYIADLDPAVGPKLLALMCTRPGARGGAACPP
jgi:hypothetical protein